MRPSLTTALMLTAAIGGCSMQVPGYESALPPARISAIDADVMDEAVTMIAQSRHAEAAERLSSLSKRFESRQEKTRAAESLFWLAYCYEKLGRNTEAAQIYGHVIQKYSQEPASRQAAQRLSQMPRAVEPVPQPPPDRRG